MRVCVTAPRTDTFLSKWHPQRMGDVVVYWTMDYRLIEQHGLGLKVLISCEVDIRNLQSTIDTRMASVSALFSPLLSFSPACFPFWYLFDPNSSNSSLESWF